MSTPRTFRESPVSPPAATDTGEPTGRGRRRRPYLLTAVVVVVVAGGAVTAVVLTNRNDPGKKTTVAPIASAPITRGDVVDTESVDGTLTYANTRTIAGASSGVVTWTPRAGAIITRGKPLYKVNNTPVTLMYGPIPLYRPLKKGVKGPDVEELERNLKALGYGDGLSVDQTFTAATATAVKNWQDDHNLDKSGSIDASQVVFESGSVRVSAVTLEKGGKIGGGAAAMTVTDISPIVHVDLDVAKQDLVHKGGKVDVEMPNGDIAKGTITSVGTVAKAGKENATIGVNVALAKKAIGRVDQAPVTVDLVSQRARNVLSVPIEALLGLREGGFGVQVVEGTSTRIVPVTVGTYGTSQVEISGTGLRAGMRVGVPSQ